MKKQLLFLSFIWLGLEAFAQLSIPNGDFEAWTSNPYQNLKYYESSNSETSQAGLAANCEKSTTAFHGTSAIRLTTVAFNNDDYPGYFVNGDPNGSPEDWHGGVPINAAPTGVRGYYQSDVQAGDTAYMIVAFSKNGINIGTYYYQFYGTHNTYTLFNLTLQPALPDVPDSVMLAAISSDFLNDNYVNGSMLMLDSITLLGVTAPANLNGDFEEWETVTSYDLDSWYFEMDDLTQVRTTDAYDGTYAVRVESELGDRDGVPHANAGRVSTGFYPRNCDSNCFEQGGYPFVNQMDTVMFWYKYTPVAGTKALVSVTSKANGQPVGGNMMELNAAASFTSIHIPIVSMSVPDTLIVTFQSSNWDDSLTTQVGAVLIVDKVLLKSEQLHSGLFNSKKSASAVTVYPNPASHTIRFDGNNLIGASFQLFNIAGQAMVEGEIQSSNQSIDISGLQGGLYFYKLERNGELQTIGKLRIE